MKSLHLSGNFFNNIFADTIRKMNDFKKNSNGDLVDDTGKVVMSLAQQNSMVRDKDGNLVDKTTGKVMFNKDGELMSDKQEFAKHVAKKEAIKKKVMQDQIKQHIAEGGKVEGFALDDRGVLKVIAEDGT